MRVWRTTLEVLYSVFGKILTRVPISNSSTTAQLANITTLSLHVFLIRRTYPAVQHACLNRHFKSTSSVQKRETRGFVIFYQMGIIINQLFT